MAMLPLPHGAQVGGGPTGAIYGDPRATPNTYSPPPPAYREGLTPKWQQGGDTGGGGAGSFSISPDAGIYGSESAAALAAYQSAQAQLLAQRNSLYNQYGFTQDGVVDPNNPYGQYQQLLGSEGHQLDADMANAAGRNLGNGGLAHQAESYDRTQQGATNVQFQRQVGDVATNYGLGLQSSKASYDQALAQAYSDAMNAALQQAMLQMMAGGGGGGSSGDGGGSTPPMFSGTMKNAGRTSTANTGAMRLPTTRVKGGKI